MFNNSIRKKSCTSFICSGFLHRGYPSHYPVCYTIRRKQHLAYKNKNIFPPLEFKGNNKISFCEPCFFPQLFFQFVQICKKIFKDKMRIFRFSLNIAFQPYFSSHIKMNDHFQFVKYFLTVH